MATHVPQVSKGTDTLVCHACLTTGIVPQITLQCHDNTVPQISNENYLFYAITTCNDNP